MSREAAVGARSVRVPTTSIIRMSTPVAVAAIPIVAFGVADGGYAPTTCRSAMLAFVVVGVAGFLIDARVSLARNSRLVVTAGVLLTTWTAASALWAPDGSLALADAERDALYVAAVVALLVVGERHGRGLAYGALVGAGLLLAIALVLFLHPHVDRSADPFEGYLLSEPIGYANAIGIVAAVGLVLTLMVGTSAALWQRRAVAASSVAFVAALSLSGSRGAMVACLVGLGMAIALGDDRPSVLAHAAALLPGLVLAITLCFSVDIRGPYPAFDQSRSSLLACGLLGAAALSAIVTPFLEATFPARPISRRVALGVLVAAAALSVAAATRADTLVDTRLAYWRVAFDMGRDHPLRGAGSGSFASAWQASGADRGARDAHGAFVEAFAELGAPGVLLLSAVLIVPLAAGVRARRTPWAAVATGAYGATIVHAAIDWDREMPVVVLVGSALAVALLNADADVLHPADESTAVANLASQVGAVRSVGNA